MRSSACSISRTRAASTCCCTADNPVVMWLLLDASSPAFRCCGSAVAPSGLLLRMRSLGENSRLRGQAVVHIVALIDDLLGAIGSDRGKAVANCPDQLGICLCLAPTDLAAGHNVERAFNGGAISVHPSAAD